MKALIVILILFSPLGLLSQCDTSTIIENDTLIYWSSERKLKWDDFQGTPFKAETIYGSPAHAVTSAPLLVEFTNNKDTIFKIHCYFMKNISWLKGERDSYLLVHEQVHFDIAELFARRMNKAMLELKHKGVVNFEPYIKVGNEIMGERDKYELQYDTETIHGQTLVEQEKWNKKVKMDLEALEEYKIDYTQHFKEE